MAESIEEDVKLVALYDKMTLSLVSDSKNQGPLP